MSAHDRPTDAMDKTFTSSLALRWRCLAGGEGEGGKREVEASLTPCRVAGYGVTPWLWVSGYHGYHGQTPSSARAGLRPALRVC